jgi:hypothetical protein
METEQILTTLRQLKDTIDKYRAIRNTSSPESGTLYISIPEIYGKVAYYYQKVTGDLKIQVPVAGVSHKLNDSYPNFFEAGYLSGRTFHQHQGYVELQKVIGIIESVGIKEEKDEPINKISSILKRFRPCCSYLHSNIDSEVDVQDIIWIMLRSNYPKVEREETLRKFGLKSYRPDFGIPDLKTLIEVKFINDKTNPKDIQEEILADIEGYLNKNEEYNNIIVFIYDKANKIKDPEPLTEDLKRLEYIKDIIITPKID